MYTNNNDDIEKLIDEMKINIDIDRKKNNEKIIDEKIHLKESKFKFTINLFENINLSTNSKNIKLSNSCPNLTINTNLQKKSKLNKNIKKKYTC